LLEMLRVWLFSESKVIDSDVLARIVNPGSQQPRLWNYPLI